MSTLHVTLSGRGALTVDIYTQILDAIVDGRLRPGDRLPPTRELALDLDVARSTVTIAYERLVAEGYLLAHVGKGTFVSRAPVHQTVATPAPPGEGLHPRAIWNEVPPRPATVAREGHDFGLGLPDPGMFPAEDWRRHAAHQLRRGALFAGGYGDPGGHPALREAIARHVGLSRSVTCDPEDVIVTNGAQHALDLLGRVLLEPGDVVAVEEPGYPPARRLLRSHGAEVVPVPVDGEGIDVTSLPDDTRLVYVTPSHQFPLGTVMSLDRRLALLAWADAHGACVVEDDYDAEFRFEDRPLEPLQTLDRHGWVVYVGSFSKTMHPALRLGFVIAPRSLQAALLSARQLTDWHGDPLTESTMARFIGHGDLATHLRRATRTYRARHTRLLRSIASHLDAWLEPVPSVAGIHVCTRLRPGADVDLEVVAAHAREAGVTVEQLADYSTASPPPRGLVIGYGRIIEERIEEGVSLLADAFRRADAA